MSLLLIYKPHINTVIFKPQKRKKKKKRKSEGSINGSQVAHGDKDSGQIAALHCHREPLLQIVGKIYLSGSTHYTATKFPDEVKGLRTENTRCLDGHKGESMD